MSKYSPKIDLDYLKLPEKHKKDINYLAARIHDLWAYKRINQGWSYGERRNDQERTTPNLIPFVELSEEEKSYDIEIVTYVVNLFEELKSHSNSVSKIAIIELDQILKDTPFYPQFQRVNLTQQLYAIRKSFEAELYEAVILYTGRVFEQIISLVLNRILHQTHGILAIHLGQLSALGLMTPHYSYRAHALRRLCNKARHGGLIVGLDALNAIKLLDKMFEWFLLLCNHLEPRTPISNIELQGDLERYIELRERAGQDAKTTLVLVDEILSQYTDNAFLSDFKMIKGLCLSRNYQLNESIKVLEVVKKEHDLIHRIDDELLCILGGVYKRKWIKYWQELKPFELTKEHTRDLRKSLKYYKQAYKHSRGNNTYASINYAAIMAWLHEENEAVKIAFEVQEKLPRVKYEDLKDTFSGAPTSTGLWCLFTRAEAQLLIGLLNRSARHIIKAEELYEQAINQGQRLGLTSDCASAINQMQFHLQILQPQPVMNALINLGDMKIT